ncbi:hypothetical protein ALC53_10725 [Atta colombica]|uniref:Uncharacterized protein n=1 Tax=Atta colombica TaxID=520822 RepID=A0A151I063_9HYME|nr:hypothetical protein ALC53_13931 [Atta colombica]KYM78854.1 hypothetical protein ALC53_10725 [Atta colombica]
MPVFDVKITVLEALKPFTTRSFTNSGLTIYTNRLIFLWGYVAQVYCMKSMIYFDHHLPLKPSIGKRRKQSCTSNTIRVIVID